MFDSQESRVNRSKDLRKEKEGTFKNLGLVAAQYNTAYSDIPEGCVLVGN